jgi:hypothetical protein
MIRLCFFILSSLLIISCGDSGTETSTPNIKEDLPIITEPPIEEITTPFYGAFDITLLDGVIRTVLLDEERSYIFSAAEKSYPPNELMCVSDESLAEFSSTLSTQTLNFICSGHEDENLSLIVELDEVTSVTYAHGQQEPIKVSVDSMVKLIPPNFSDLSSGDYTTPARDDIDVSRYISVSPRSLYYSFIIFSRDWPIGGKCLSAMDYRLTDFSSITVKETSEVMEVPYSGTLISAGSNCDSKILPMPSALQSLAVQIYSLEDGSYFIVFEQDSFITIGRVY